MATLKFFGGLLLALVLVAGAFAAIFALGWAAVHLAGPPLFHLLPAPIAYLLTSIAAAGAVYGAFHLATGRRRLHVKQAGLN